MKKLKDEADKDLLWELKMAVGRKKKAEREGTFSEATCQQTKLLHRDLNYGPFYWPG